MIDSSYDYTYNRYRIIEILELLNCYENDILIWSGYEEPEDQICAEWAVEQIKEVLDSAVDTSPLMLIEAMSETWREWADESTGETSKHMFNVAATMAYYVREYFANEWWKGVA